MSAKNMVEIKIKGSRIILPASTGIELFKILTSADGIYSRDYDWKDSQVWVEPLPMGEITLGVVTQESFAIMKLIGANKIAEREAERARAANEKDKT